jgi:hypothetical protein
MSDYKQEIFQEKGLSAFYCVDYRDLTEMRWVRNPFCTWEEVQMILEVLPYGHDEATGELIPLFEGFRITPEENLSRLRQNWNPETEEYVNDETTERVKMLGERYEGIAEKITGEASLMRICKPGFGWTMLSGKGETKDEWEARVRLAEQKEEEAEENLTPYQELQKQLVLEWIASHPAKNPFSNGNTTFRTQSPEMEALQKQLVEMQLCDALEDAGSSGNGSVDL